MCLKEQACGQVGKKPRVFPLKASIPSVKSTQEEGDSWEQRGWGSWRGEWERRLTGNTVKTLRFIFANGKECIFTTVYVLKITPYTYFHSSLDSSPIQVITEH